MIDSPCLSTETLQELLAATGEGPSADSARAHLEGCERCQALLDALSEDSEMHRWATEGPALRRPRPQEPGLQRLVQALCAASVDGTFPGAVSAPLTFLGPPRQPGDLGTLGPYRVLAELGRGGRGVVLRGYDEELDREVALKVLRPDLEAGTHARLLAEARAAARFQHGNVVAVHAVADTPEGLPYLVMEYLRGPTLAERLRDRPPPTVDEVVTAVAQVADALAAAHAAGLVHRDVKPGNIILAPLPGERCRAKLLDFGLARAAEQPGARTLAGFLAGTPADMSSEQARGQARLDGRSDVYGLGATLYEALTGEPPFRGKPHLVLQQVLLEEPRPPRRLNDAVPRDLETICLKAMAREPSGRYSTAAALADDLRRFQSGEPIHARPVSRPERLWRWGRRNPGLAILTTALVLAVASGFAAVLWQWRRAEFNAAQARLQAEEARHQKDEALANLGQACQAVDRFLTEVSESDLARNPGTQALRKRLLQEALTCYQALLRRHGSDPHLLDAVAKAWFRVGTIAYLEIGKVEEAQAAFATAVEKYEELRRREPDNPAQPREALRTALTHASGEARR